MMACGASSWVSVNMTTILALHTTDVGDAHENTRSTFPLSPLFLSSLSAPPLSDICDDRLHHERKLDIDPTHSQRQ